MIKISRGVYGFIDENGTVRPKTARDGAFSVSKDEKARLVNLGVAEYVGEEPRKEPPSEEPPEENPEEDIPEIPDENPDEEPKTKKKTTTKRR